MWPFKKKSVVPVPEPVSAEGLTAQYDGELQRWGFQCDGIEFDLSGIPFDQRAFAWAKESSAQIRTLNEQIRARVMECLEGWPCDKTKAEILSVDLDEYAKSKTINIAFIGDESWGDFGVNVIITDGKIVDAYGGD